MFLSLVTLLLVAVVGVLFVRERRSSRPADAPPDPLHISWLRFFRALRAHSGDFDAVLADFASDPAAVDAPVVRLPSVPLLPLPPLHFVVGEAALTDYHYSKELSMMEGLSLLIDNYAAKPSAGDAASRKSAQRMARAISPDKHATFIRVVWEELGKTIDAWPVEGQLDVFKDVYEFTTDLITKAVIGTDLKGEQLKQFIQDIRMVDPIEGLLVAPWAVLLPRWLFQLTSYGKELGNAHKRLFDAISGIADARIEKEAKGEPRKTDFFGYLIEVLGEEQEASIDGRSYNSEELTGMCVGLIFAANTNTFASACWTIINLIRYPEHMARVKEEVAAARQQHPDLTASGSMTSAFLDSLVYLEACIRENIRLYMTAASFRRAMSDTNLCGRFIPKGSLVLAKETYVHTLPHLFPDPLAFKPERHLISVDGVNGIDMSLARQGKLIVFGAGRHACVGAKVATQVIKMQVLNVIERFEKFELQGEVSTRTVQFGGVARPEEPVVVRYKKRV